MHYESGKDYYLKRTGDSNSRVREGVIYKAKIDTKVHPTKLYIMDDEGNTMAPSISNCESWWKDVTNEIDDNKKKVNKMLTIQNVTILTVGGKEFRSEDLSVEDILEFIEIQQDKISHLQRLNIKSEAIEKIVSRHELNVTRLLKILDSK